MWCGVDIMTPAGERLTCLPLCYGPCKERLSSLSSIQAACDSGTTHNTHTTINPYASKAQLRRQQRASSKLQRASNSIVLIGCRGLSGALRAYGWGGGFGLLEGARARARAGAVPGVRGDVCSHVTIWSGVLVTTPHKSSPSATAPTTSLWTHP